MNIFNIIFIFGQFVTFVFFYLSHHSLFEFSFCIVTDALRVQNKYLINQFDTTHRKTINHAEFHFNELILNRFLHIYLLLYPPQPIFDFSTSLNPFMT